MKVLHIYRTYLPETQGGLQEAIRQISLATQPFQVKNTVFTLARTPTPHRLLRPEAEVIRAKSWWAPASCDLGSPYALWLAHKAAKDADIIQFHYPWPFGDLVLPFIRRRHQALIVTYHSDIVRQKWLNQFYAPLRNRLLGSADAIIATSPDYLASSQILAQYQHKTQVIPLCVGKRSATSPERIAYWQAHLPPKPFFLFVGVLRYYKGLHILIEAMRHLDANLVIVGEGPEMSRLRAQAATGRHDNVIFLGGVSDEDREALYDMSYAFVFSSHLRSEAFGVTLLEAARAGKAMISCEITTGTSYVNVHGLTGLTVPPNDAHALHQSMRHLLGAPALARQFGQAAYARWQVLFTPDEVGQRYFELYQRLVG